NKGLIGTLMATDYKEPKQVAIPVLTPDRLEKRQNGRRFKTDGDPMFTLTSQDRHGILLA
ncbi:DNA (cytosine-5-)-methyltransferase, partial [Streptococcus canis]